MAINNNDTKETIVTRANAHDILCDLLLPAPDQKLRIGEELEVFLINKKTGAPIHYDQHQQFLHALAEPLGFDKGYETDPNTGHLLLTHLKGKGAKEGWLICGEPGCQFEWAPGPVATVTDVATATDHFLETLASLAAESGHGIVIPGLYPLGRGINIPLSGRPRYHALQPRIEAVPHNFGHDLSRGTCGLQINIDTTPDNWIQTVQTALAIQPVLVALFANSPFFDNEATPAICSNRATLWFEQWGARTKELRDIVANKNFSVTTYIDYVLNQEVPILVRATGDVPLGANVTLGDLLDPATRPAQVTGNMSTRDCANAMGTFYGLIKIKPKGIIELRGPDASYELRHALKAFAVGLFYDAQALGAAHTLISTWTEQERDTLAYQAPRDGLKTSFRGVPLSGVAAQLCDLAHQGLVRRGLGEENYLVPLCAIACGDEPTQAEAALNRHTQGEDIKTILLESIIGVPERRTRACDLSFAGGTSSLKP